MKLIVVSGFLGAGKTISILSLADRILKDTGEDSRNTSGDGATKLVIIENEIGDVGFDDALLSAKKYQVKNLLSGCICCTLASNLIDELHSIAAQYDPEYVIFEPTGVAFPKNILEDLGTYGKAVDWIRTVTIVDAPRFHKLLKVTPFLITDQVQNADLILLNKADLVSADCLETAKDEIQALNPSVKIEVTVAQTGIEPEIWDEVLRDV